MLEYMIIDLRRTVTRMLLRARPPRTVWLEKPHAEYLKLNFNPGVNIDPPTRQQPAQPGDKPMPPLVEVQFQQLVVNLKGAKGVEHD